MWMTGTVPNSSWLEPSAALSVLGQCVRSNNVFDEDYNWVEVRRIINGPMMGLHYNPNDKQLTCHQSPTFVAAYPCRRIPPSLKGTCPPPLTSIRHCQVDSSSETFVDCRSAQ